VSEPTRFEPPISAVSEPYWEATRERRLVLQHCDSCERTVWYPRVLCPHCGGIDLTWRDATGHGAVYAVSVQYRPGHPGLADRVPYAVALVDLDDGVRVMTSVVGCAAEDVHIGQRVRPTWEELSDGRNLLMHEPEAS
jgi:uncharacterized OB-fold protein